MIYSYDFDTERIHRWIRGHSENGRAVLNAVDIQEEQQIVKTVRNTEYGE